MQLNTENIKNTLNKPIALIGMMGTGKTHIGKMLAEALELDFFDSDKIIEDRGGLSINEIFEMYGEERFRQSEEKTILELLDYGACVIATGGGAPVNPAILSAIKTNTISVWLKSDVDIIYERIKQSKTRPLLNEDNPKTILSELLAEREKFYEQADIIIKVHNNNPSIVLSEMIEAIDDLL